MAFTCGAVWCNAQQTSPCRKASFSCPCVRCFFLQRLRHRQPFRPCRGRPLSQATSAGSSLTRAAAAAVLRAGASARTLPTCRIRLGRISISTTRDKTLLPAKPETLSCQFESVFALNPWHSAIVLNPQPRGPSLAVLDEPLASLDAEEHQGLRKLSGSDFSKLPCFWKPSLASANSAVGSLNGISQSSKCMSQTFRTHACS